MNLEQLEKLNNLKQKGIITQDEFEAKKKELLDTPLSNSINHEKEKSLWGYFILNITEKYACFSGRARRKEYFGFLLFFALLLNGIPMLIIALTQDAKLANFVYWMLYALMFFPSLGLWARRLHDANFSGLWCIFPYIVMLLSIFIPMDPQNNMIMILYIILLIISSIAFCITFFRSYPKENEYGPVPVGVLLPKTGND